MEAQRNIRKPLKLAEQEMGGWWLALRAMGNFKVDPENSA